MPHGRTAERISPTPHWTGANPGAETLLLNADKEVVEATCLAALAAADGSEATKNMKAVWGRAAYFAETSIGVLDGGSVVGKLIFEAIAEWAKANEAA